MGPTSFIHALPKRRERHFGDRVVWCFHERLPTIYTGFAKAVAEYRDKTALICGLAKWSYGELELEVGRLAHGLKQLGVLPGDRVAMLIRNRAEFVTTFYAVQRLGAVCVPMDVRLQGTEIAHVLATSGARVFLHDENLNDRLSQIRSDLTEVQMVGLPETGAIFPDSRVTDATPPYEGATEEDTALILYTSGTTGQPKGASIAHFNVAHSVIHHTGNLGLNHTDRCLVAVPISHITGLLCGVIAPLFAGGSLILLPFFKAQEFVATATEVRMTYTIMVPAMYNLCLRVPDFDRYDLSSWRLGHFGGSPMPEATIDALAHKLPNLTLVNGYGATETCSPAIMMPVGESVAPHGAVGKALPCVEVLIMDPETGIEVPKGTSGEIWLRGPMVIANYWNNPQATADSIIGGFWRSGDIGRMDEAGYVYVHDRLKDMINRGGYKIYSAEVESVLAHFPGVVEAAIVGKPDPVLGERVHAFVCYSAPISEDELRAFCAARLADYKIPESWTLSKELLPRSATGKLAKKLLHDMIESK